MNHDTVRYCEYKYVTKQIKSSFLSVRGLESVFCVKEDLNSVIESTALSNLRNYSVLIFGFYLQIMSVSLMRLE